MRPGVLVVLLLAPLLAPTAQAATCYYNTSFGRFEGPCPYGDEGQGEEKGEWYTTQAFEIGLAIFGLLASAAAGGYTYYRVRERRRTLADYLKAIETTYLEAKRAPDAGVPKLVALRAEIRARHEAGRIEDAQLLQLDKRLGDHIARLRLLEIERRFAALPAPFLAELRHLVADGIVSDAEADLIEAHAYQHRVAEPHRSALVRTVRAWARDDAGALAHAEDAAPSA